MKIMEQVKKHSVEGGERIVAPSRRPDGSLRKAIRIRAGYVPQDEVALYQSKGSLRDSPTTTLPGYAPILTPTPSVKASKRTGRTKGRPSPLCAFENDKNMVMTRAGDKNSKGVSTAEISPVIPLLTDLSILEICEEGTSLSKGVEESNERDHIQRTDKKIRSLKKKIRLIEETLQSGRDRNDMNPDQLNKISKLGDFQTELKILEDRKSGILH